MVLGVGLRDRDSAPRYTETPRALYQGEEVAARLYSERRYLLNRPLNHCLAMYIHAAKPAQF